jgi:hypothetical protein
MRWTRLRDVRPEADRLRGLHGSRLGLQEQLREQRNRTGTLSITHNSRRQLHPEDDI